MTRYILQRVIAMILTMVVVITLTFILMHAIPGGPFASEKNLPPQIKANIEAKYGLNKPLYQQYFDYWAGLLRGDLGPSYKYPGRTVNDLIEDGFPISAELGIYAILLMLFIGIPAGIISALRQYHWQDSVVMIFATLGVAVPSFVLATLFIYIFSSRLGILPAARWLGWQYKIMPTVALSAYNVSFIARLTRSSMLDVMSQDYIRTARAKGLSETAVVIKHALKNSLIPIVTVLGPLIAAVLTGSFVIEKIFAIPGLGRQFVDSVSNRDYTTIMGVTIFYGAFLVIMNLIVDIIYVFIDPRIKLAD